MTLIQTEPKSIKIGTGSTPRLPAEYQEVEYIESSGTQYIDTGVKASNTLSTELVMRPNMSYTSEYAIWGDAWSASALFLMEYHGKYRLHNGGQYGDFANVTDVKTTITTNNTGITINGTSYTLNAGSSYSNNNIWLFATGDGSNTNKRGRFKVYSLEISNSGTLVRNFVPCYRKSDDVIGLYDLVNNQFYINSGTGTFTKGANIGGEKEIKKIVIFPDGVTEKQIRPAGWKPGANTLLYLPFTSDMLDHSGNNRVVTTDIGIIQNGYFYNDNTNVSSRGLTIQNMPALTNFTTTFYEKKTGTYANNQQAVFIYAGGSQIHSIDFANKIRFGVWGWANDPSVPNNGADVWRLLTYVKNGNNFSFYINATLISSASRTGVSQPAGDHYYFGWGSAYYPLIGYASQLIVEDKARTATEISDYYNLTKGTYGL